MSQFAITRRRLGATALAAGLLGGRRAAADAGGKIVVATWGGGVGDTWRKAFGQPFQAETKKFP